MSFAIVRKQEVFFLEIRNWLAVRIAHDHVYEHNVDAHFERRWRIVRYNFVVGRFRIWLWNVPGYVWLLSL